MGLKEKLIAIGIFAIVGIIVLAYLGIIDISRLGIGRGGGVIYYPPPPPPQPKPKPSEGVGLWWIPLIAIPILLFVLYKYSPSFRGAVDNLIGGVKEKYKTQREEYTRRKKLDKELGKAGYLKNLLEQCIKFLKGEKFVEVDPETRREAEELWNQVKGFKKSVRDLRNKVYDELLNINPTLAFKLTPLVKILREARKIQYTCEDICDSLLPKEELENAKKRFENIKEKFSIIKSNYDELMRQSKILNRIYKEDLPRIYDEDEEKASQLEKKADKTISYILASEEKVENIAGKIRGILEEEEKEERKYVSNRLQNIAKRAEELRKRIEEAYSTARLFKIPDWLAKGLEMEDLIKRLRVELHPEIAMMEKLRLEELEEGMVEEVESRLSKIEKEIEDYERFIKNFDKIKREYEEAEKMVNERKKKEIVERLKEKANIYRRVWKNIQKKWGEASEDKRRQFTLLLLRRNYAIVLIYIKALNKILPKEEKERLLSQEERETLKNIEEGKFTIKDLERLENICEKLKEHFEKG